MAPALALPKLLFRPPQTVKGLVAVAPTRKTPGSYVRLN